MPELMRTTLGSLGELFDGPHATPTRRKDGPYFLNIASLKSGRLDLSQSDHVSEADFQKWTRRVTPEPGDLLFSYETRLGEAALMLDGIQACLGRRMALLRPDRSVVDPRFLLYYYLSPSFQRTIERSTIHGATVERIGLATMPSWKVEIPVLADQRAIGEVLGALDGKIAANSSIISLLDSLVRATYASLPGTICRLDEVATNVRVSVRPGDLDSGTTYMGLEHVPRRRMWALDAGTSNEVTSTKSAFRSDDVLFGKLRPYFHKVVSAGTSGVCSTDILVVRANDPNMSGLVLAACASDEVVRACTGASGGTRMPRTNWRDLGAAPVRWPGERAARQFSEQAKNRSLLAHSLLEESRRLAATRDELLPLLISGKLRVRDAEKAVEEVV